MAIEPSLQAVLQRRTAQCPAHAVGAAHGLVECVVAVGARLVGELVAVTELAHGGVRRARGNAVAHDDGFGSSTDRKIAYGVSGGMNDRCGDHVRIVEGRHSLWFDAKLRLRFLEEGRVDRPWHDVGY